MAKKFLGSVGTAEAFRRNADGKLELAFRSKTLTDSGINISTTKDEIRGGTGAPVQLVFCHDTTAEITLTDILFDEAYVQAQLGTGFAHGGESYQSETLTAGEEGGHIGVKLSYEPRPLPISCSGDATVVLWSEPGKDEWKVADTFDQADPTKVELKGAESGKDYCVRYLRYNDNAHVAEILSDFIPEELFLVITAPIFAGDACSASNGKKAGTITYEVPRFKLSGSLDIANNMSSNATMSLSGSALASESKGCDINGSTLVRIISVDDNISWSEEASGIAIVGQDKEEPEKILVGDPVAIYGVFKNEEVSTEPIENLHEFAVVESTSDSGEEDYTYLDLYVNEAGEHLVDGGCWKLAGEYKIAPISKVDPKSKEILNVYSEKSDIANIE